MESVTGMSMVGPIAMPKCAVGVSTSIGSSEIASWSHESDAMGTRSFEPLPAGASCSIEQCEYVTPPRTQMLTHSDGENTPPTRGANTSAVLVGSVTSDPAVGAVCLAEPDVDAYPTDPPSVRFGMTKTSSAILGVP